MMGLGEAIRLTESILTGAGSKPGLLTTRSLAKDFADVSTISNVASSANCLVIINGLILFEIVSSQGTHPKGSKLQLK